MIVSGPLRSNPSQLNTDGEAQGNAWDGDDDGDGMPDPVDADPLDAGNTNEVGLPLDGNYKGQQFKQQGLTP